MNICEIKKLGIKKSKYGEKGKKIKYQGNDILIKECGYYEKKKRYLLNIKIGFYKKEKVLDVIMLNPSEYYSDKENIIIDKTVTNVVKIAIDNGYNEINILNLFSVIQPDSNRVNFNNPDIEFLKAYFEKSQNTILVAWGYRFKNNNNKIKELIELLKNKEIKTFDILEKNYPKHPGRTNIENYRNKKTGKVELKDYNFYYNAHI